MKTLISKWSALPLNHFLQKEHQTNKLFLITGPSGTGKTTWCRQWVDSARTDGWRIGGLLSLPVMAGTQKVAIDLVELANGEKQQLAALRQNTSGSGSLSTGKWLFDTAVLAWGNEMLRRITAVDLLIIDELGPLEFGQCQGLQAAFELIEAGRYRLAGVVIRPSLLAQAQQRWPWSQTIPVTWEPII